MLPIKENCCGCGVCANVCVMNACEMMCDEEGFFYPQINIDKCVTCGVCEHLCPVLSGDKYYTVINRESTYCGYCFDEDSVKKSASGGGC